MSDAPFIDAPPEPVKVESRKIRRLPVKIALQPKQMEAFELLRPGTRPVIVGLGGSRGGGKAAPLDSRVLTPKGWALMGDLKVGDVVTDPTTGGHTTVIGYFPQGVQQVYRVTCDDGAEVEVVGEHLWAYKTANHIRPGTKKAKFHEIQEQLSHGLDRSRWSTLRVGTTFELIELLKKKKHGVRIPLTEPVQFTVNGQKGTVNPYLMGLLLGDGHLPTVTISTLDDGIREYLLAHGFKAFSALGSDGKPKTYRANGETFQRIRNWLYDHRLFSARSWEKFLPEYVFTWGLEDRLELLRGLMDTDGYIDERGRASFCSTSLRLAKGVQELVWSLGGKASISEKHPTYTYKGEKRNGRLAYFVAIWVRRNSSLFRLERKKSRSRDRWNGGAELMREIVSIVPTRETECACIKVSSPFGLYVAEDYIVTHNTHFISAWMTYMVGRHDAPIRGYVFRRTMDDLQDTLIQPAMMIWPWLANYWKEQKKMFAFPGNRFIRFVSGENIMDIFRLAGKEAAFIAIDQAEQFSQEELEFFRTLNRWPRDSRVRSKMLWTFNPGGIGAEYLKRVMVKRQFQDNEVGEDFAFVDAKGWDNVEHVRAWLEGHGHDASWYYRQDDKTRFELFVNESSYGRGLNSLPDDMRQAHLFGDWDTFAGQFFHEWRYLVHVLRGRLKEFPTPITLGGAIDYGRYTCMELGFRNEVGHVEFFDECWTEDLPPIDRAHKCADVIERWGLWNLFLLYDTDMEQNLKNYRGGDKMPIHYFREVFKERFGDRAPIMVKVSKRSPDNRLYREVCNEAFRQFLSYKRDEKGDVRIPPLMTVWEQCPKLIQSIPSLQYPSVEKGEKGNGLDFNRKVGQPHSYDSAKYLLMYLREAWAPVSERPITSDQDYFDRVILPRLMKKQNLTGYGSRVYADTI